ncbi:MAG: hypothetical protein K1X28_05925 [Parachlamydiales bacterium]|nr:hypothetical protein [Parachlamydiales bacterium]
MSLQAVNLVPMNLPPASSSEPEAVDNGVLQAAIRQIYETVLNANFFQNLQRKAEWVWNTTVESLKSEWLVISLIAFAAYAAFGFAVAVQATVVFACARFAIVTWKDQGAQKDVERLTGENVSLRLRNQELSDEIEIGQHRADHAVRERDLHRQESERVRQLRDELILQRAPLLDENARLQEESATLHQEKDQWEQLRAQLEQQLVQLREERDTAVHAKEEQEGDLQRALRDAQQAREQMGGVHTFDDFNRTLAEMREYYEGRRQGMAPDPDAQLVAKYRETRLEWNQKLSDYIQTLDRNSIARIQLERILAVSQGEVEHVAGISALLNLHIAYQAQLAAQEV